MTDNPTQTADDSSLPEVEEWDTEKMQAWWANMLKRSNAATEAQTKFDGFLSYSTEFHSVAIGFAAGFGAVAPIPTELRLAIAATLGMDSLGPRKLFGEGTNTHVAAEVRKEPWYAILGLFAGFAAATAMQYAANLGFAF